MTSVFQKFGGIRPMAGKIGVPSSTVKSWHAKKVIPDWRHAAILAVAQAEGIKLSEDELAKVREDDPAFDINGRAVLDNCSTGAAA